MDVFARQGTTPNVVQSGPSLPSQASACALAEAMIKLQVGV